MDSTTVDSGPSGFLGIFGKSQPAPAEPDHDVTPSEPTVAEASTPDVPDQDLSAEEIVAARFAASLAESGIEVPDTGELEPDTTESPESHPLLAKPDGDQPLDSLTPEQLRALAEEAIRLRSEVSTTSRNDAARKVQMAEATAVAQVQAAYDRDVIAVADRHYAQVFAERAAEIIRTSSEDEAVARVTALQTQINRAREQWVDQQTVAYEQRAQAAALAARKSVPEMRRLYAAELVKQAGLPETAVPEVLKVRNTDDFAAEVEKLVGMRDALLAERQRNQQSRRVEANQALRDTTPRTAATGRPPGGKPPEYKGTAAEGARILSLFHNRS